MTKKKTQCTRRRDLLVLCNITLLALLSTVIYQSSISMTASIFEGLQGLRIDPNDNVTVTTGGSQWLTAVGQYATTEVPIRAKWSLFPQNDEAGKLDNCTNTKNCEFIAGEEAGQTTIQAQIGDGEFIDTVDITIEKAEEVLKNPFTDELPNWAFEEIVRMHQKGIVKGYDDGRYGPGDPVTNGQVITLLYRILTSANLIEEPSIPGLAYDDVAPDHYAYTPAYVFHSQGWSTSEDFFNPNDPASRGAVAGFVNRVLGGTIITAIGKRPTDGVQFFDDVPLDHHNYSDTAITNTTGIMTGYPNGDFGIDDDFNRAAAAVVMFRILNILDENDVTDLQGYNPDTFEQHPAALTEPSVTAACIIVAENASTPNANNPRVGDGFVKDDQNDFHTLTTIRQYCTDALFEELMEEFCALGTNRERRAQWGVTLYDDEGNVYVGGGAMSESNWHTCGVPCNDNVLCTKNDMLENGICKGIPYICNDDNICTKDMCNGDGNCTYIPNDRIACDDGNSATTSDTCRNGDCVGVSV